MREDFKAIQNALEGAFERLYYGDLPSVKQWLRLADFETAKAIRKEEEDIRNERLGTKTDSRIKKIQQ